MVILQTTSVSSGAPLSMSSNVLRLVVQTILLLTYIMPAAISLRCDRTPEASHGLRSTSDGRFLIDISGNPETYVPGEQYTIFLRGMNDYQTQHKFKDFLLLVEHEVSEKPLAADQIHSPSVGSLQLYGDMLTKFSERCRNSVIQTNSLPKSEVQVLWLAPPAGSGCVSISATVVETKDVWYSSDGPLSKILCEELQENEDIQPNVLRHCCACDEAKYEVTFEGLWSRNTHPKDFPSNGWLTRFSDIIGASHTVDYTFWNYGDIASEGLRQLAENGNTRMLESELKAKSEHIRTIIKARGISYPNITGRTFAVFRVDNRHHLMSLVAMLDPSPDWVVGVSSLELCLRNCSWVESRVLNLYPWDVGTDDGPSYISNNQPSSPRHPIRRIKSNSPNDPRSPFYDPSGAEMKPLARLYLTRQRLYEKNCDTSSAMGEYEDGEGGGGAGAADANCEVDEWSDWSPCSATCGKGVKYKQRGYKNEDSKYHCRVVLTKRAPCWAHIRYCRNQQHSQEEDPRCALTEFGEWSSCSAECGMGWKTRSRRYKNRSAAKRCAVISDNVPQLEQSLECHAERPCNSGEEPAKKECADRDWSTWSPCSASCGKGIKIRRKIALDNTPKFSFSKFRRGRNLDFEEDEEDEDNEEDDEDIESNDPCSNVEERVECINDEHPNCVDNSNGDSVTDDYFNGIKPGSQTVDRRMKEYYPKADGGIIERPVGDVIDCQLSPWSAWTPCNATCGRGFKTKHRIIKAHPMNGGKRCPEKILKKRKCKSPCPGDRDVGFSGENSIENEQNDRSMLPTWGPTGLFPTAADQQLPRRHHQQQLFQQQQYNKPVVDCVMSRWSAWSPCSRSCGPHAVQQRTRSIVQSPSGRGAARCMHRTEERPCALLACPE